MEAVLAANRAVMLRKGRTEGKVWLEDDVAGYFADLRALPSLAEAAAVGPLAGRGRGIVALEPHRPCTSYQFADFVLTVGGLELPSNLRV